MRLSEALRSQTRDVHAETERSPFVVELLRGERGLNDYAAMLAQHLFVYQALEEERPARAGDPLLAPFLDPALDRAAAIRADLAHLCGPDRALRSVALPATQQYVDRIRRPRTSPVSFLAHHYTRYLGDLSGGQVIRRLLRRRFGLGEAALEFYRFADLVDPEAFKAAYRGHLDALPWTEPERAAMIAEVRCAYRCNRLVFEALAAAPAAIPATF